MTKWTIQCYKALHNHQDLTQFLFFGHCLSIVHLALCGYKVNILYNTPNWSLALDRDFWWPDWTFHLSNGRSENKLLFSGFHEFTHTTGSPSLHWCVWACCFLNNIKPETTRKIWLLFNRLCTRRNTRTEFCVQFSIKVQVWFAFVCFHTSSPHKFTSITCTNIATSDLFFSVLNQRCHKSSLVPFHINCWTVSQSEMSTPPNALSIYNIQLLSISGTKRPGEAWTRPFVWDKKNVVSTFNVTSVQSDLRFVHCCLSRVLSWTTGTNHLWASGRERCEQCFLGQDEIQIWVPRAFLSCLIQA